jgi:hypothetical protein
VALGKITFHWKCAIRCPLVLEEIAKHVCAPLNSSCRVGSTEAARRLIHIRASDAARRMPQIVRVVALSEFGIGKILLPSNRGKPPRRKTLGRGRGQKSRFCWGFGRTGRPDFQL